MGLRGETRENVPLILRLARGLLRAALPRWHYACSRAAKRSDFMEYEEKMKKLRELLESIPIHPPEGYREPDESLQFAIIAFKVGYQMGKNGAQMKDLGKQKKTKKRFAW